MNLSSAPRRQESTITDVVNAPDLFRFETLQVLIRIIAPPIVIKRNRMQTRFYRRPWMFGRVGPRDPNRNFINISQMQQDILPQLCGAAWDSCCRATGIVLILGSSPKRAFASDWTRF